MHTAEIQAIYKRKELHLGVIVNQTIPHLVDDGRLCLALELC